MRQTVGRVALLAACCSCAIAVAQTGKVYTAADYAKAEQSMDYNLLPLIYHTVKDPVWIGDDRFWYRDAGPDGVSFFLVDAAKRTKGPAFDQVKLAAALTAALPSSASRTPFDAMHLPLEAFTLEDSDRIAVLTIGGRLVRCDLGAYTCKDSGPSAPGVRGIAYNVAPDGHSAAFIRENNLWMRDLKSGHESQLTTDGIPDFGYATDNAGWSHSDKAVLAWSPDSKKIATFQLDQRNVGRMYLVSTTVGHPRLESWHYPLAGDETVATIQRVVIDVDSHKVVRLKMPPDQHRSTLCDDISCRDDNGWEDVQFSDDSRHLLFASTSRDHKQEWLRLADTATGDIREVFTETVATDFESGDGRINWRYLPQTSEVLWFSERDNWGQLYLYDLNTGKLKNQITHGDGNVTQVLHVDSKSRTVYFKAVGKTPGRDPYFTAFYRVNLDGSGFKELTSGDGDHDVTMSPGGTSFLDIASSPIAPQVTTVRDSDGNPLVEVAHQDISKIQAAGWKPLTPITVKARDGKTDLYGFLFKPSTLDESKHYPIVDYIYPGPQTGSCGKRPFAAAHRDMQSLAELGFVVVCIDGMGTPNRSKSFHDALYGDLADNTVPDQVSGIRQLAAKYPWMDVDRVGIYGHSGGGAATGAAMFHEPDFFKVGISESGNHDNRLYEDDWGEKWIGLLKKNPDGTTNYDSQANQSAAKNLKGHLLLMHGTMDDNVPPNNTLVVVDALIKANKDFDLIMLPNAHHGYQAASPYATRRRWDYFIRYLAGGTPPDQYLMKSWAEQEAARGRSPGSGPSDGIDP